MLCMSRLILAFLGGLLFWIVEFRGLVGGGETVSWIPGRRSAFLLVAEA